MKNINLDRRIGPTIQVGKKSYLFFSGTSYLGIDHDQHYQAVLLDCIRQYGFSHGLSRVNNVRLKVYEAFEQYFAKKAQAEDAAVMNSGYLSGITAIQYLFPKSDLCWAAPDTHPAILPASFKPDVQLNFTQWKIQCLDQSEQLSPRKILILGNAVDPLRAEIHDYTWVQEVAKKHEVTLLIDDSHAFGVLGKNVFGTYAENSFQNVNLVISGSLGKGLAMPAGIILGKKEVIEGIKAQAIFAGASPCPPANLQAFLETQDIYKAQSQEIKDFSAIFHQETADLSTVSGSAKFPVFVLKDPTWSDELEKMGFITSSFSYPTPESPRISRIVLSGFHSLFDLMALVEAIHCLDEEL